ncbi:MAG TPA: hypothetical protein VGJ00_03880 [Rhabdochlamydiaceae bacterium]
MGKNRKKPRKKGKHRRYALRSEAKPFNTGPTPASVEAHWREERKIEEQKRNTQNQVSLSQIREIWKGSRRQGEIEYYRIVVKEIKHYYQLALQFSGNQFVWEYTDWRTEKRKLSIVYGSKERAFEVMNSERGITWKTEMDFDGNVR